MKRKLWIAAAVMVLLAVLWCGSAMANTQASYILKGINAQMTIFSFREGELSAFWNGDPEYIWENASGSNHMIFWEYPVYSDPEHTIKMMHEPGCGEDFYFMVGGYLQTSEEPEQYDFTQIKESDLHITMPGYTFNLLRLDGNEQGIFLYYKAHKNPYVLNSISCCVKLNKGELSNSEHAEVWKDNNIPYVFTTIENWEIEHWGNYSVVGSGLSTGVDFNPWEIVNKPIRGEYYYYRIFVINSIVDDHSIDFTSLTTANCLISQSDYDWECIAVNPTADEGKDCVVILFRVRPKKYRLMGFSANAEIINDSESHAVLGIMDASFNWNDNQLPVDKTNNPISVSIRGGNIYTDDQCSSLISKNQMEPDKTYYSAVSISGEYPYEEYFDLSNLSELSCLLNITGNDTEVQKIEYHPKENSNQACVTVFYKIRKACYTASFESNGGSGEMGSEFIPIGFRYTFPENGFTAPAGKTFGIWHIPSGINDGNGKRYYFLPGEEIMPANDFTAMPVWIDAPAEQVPATLTFRPGNNATGTAFNRTGYVGQPFTLPDCTFTGPEHTYFWRWRGVWFDNGVQVTQDYGENESVTVAAGGMTFTAVFTNEIPYKVTFSGNGYQLVYKGETATRPADPVSSGYIFSGWYTDRTYSTAYNFSTPVTRSFTLYPKWETEPAQEYCTVRLDADEGTGYHEILVPKGGKFVLPSTLNYPMTPPAGQEFDTWAGYGKPGTVITVNNDMTIYAAWWDKPPLIFTEDSSAIVGGHLTVDIEAMASRSYMIRTALEDNTLTYKWYVGGSGQPEDEDSNRLEITPDMLHHVVQLVINYPGSFGTNAYYSENMYVLPAVCKVHFYTPNDDIPDQYVINGQCAARPGIIPTYDDKHVFLGWFESLIYDTPFDFTQPVTDHTTVYPHWKLAGSCGENAYWELEDNTLRIYGSGAMDDYGSDDHAPWYEFSNSITGIVVETGITHIGSYAFDGNDGFYKPVTVSLPAGLASIGSYAFVNCTGLRGLTIPYSVTDIGTGAFQGSGLKSIVIPEHVNEIKDDTFNGCSTLTTAVLPSGLLRIGEGAFSHTGIRSLWLPSKVTSIGNEAFYHCENLTGGITIPSSMQSIGTDAFAYCRNLTSLRIMNGLTSIGDYAFENCTGLNSVTIPASVSSIGYAAFFGDTGLEAVTIMNPDAQIDGSAFYGCTGLTLYGFAGSTTEVHAAANDIPFVPMNVDNPTFFLPSALTKIDSDAFTGISARGIVIPKNVTEITGNPFSNSGLTTVYGYPGTEAETFASDYKYYFVPIDDAWMARHKAK